MESAVAERLIALLGQANFQQAEREAREALRKYPESAEILNLLGAAQLQQERLADSIASFKAAIKIDPDYAPAYSNLGSAHRTLGEISPAMEYAKRATELAPDDAVSFNNLGNCYVSLGDFETARRHFLKALRLHPDLTHARNSVALLFFRAGLFDEALAVTDDTMRRYPGNMDTIALKATILEAQHKLDEAEQLLKSAPRPAASHIGLAIAEARVDLRRKRFSRIIKTR